MTTPETEAKQLATVRLLPSPVASVLLGLRAIVTAFSPAIMIARVACEASRQKCLKLAHEVDHQSVAQILRLLKHPPARLLLLDGLFHRQYPAQCEDSADGYQCAYCDSGIGCEEYVTVHRCCKGPAWRLNEMKRAGLLVSLDGCGVGCCICGEAVNQTEQHHCQHPVLRTYRVDWSACKDHAQRIRKRAAPGVQALRSIRDSYGHLVLVTPREGSPGGTGEDSGRCHVLVGNSSMGAAVGKGLFALQEMLVSKRRAPQIPAEGHPWQNQYLVGYYVGKVRCVPSAPTQPSTSSTDSCSP